MTMRLDQLNLKQARIWVKRSKNSLDTEQAIEGDELRAIKRYLATRKDKLPWLLVSERGQPMTRQAVNYLIREAGERAGLGRVWPHMLRHSAGYALSNKGHDFRLLQDFMGHRDPWNQAAICSHRPARASSAPAARAAADRHLRFGVEIPGRHGRTEPEVRRRCSSSCCTTDDLQISVQAQ